MTFMPSPAACEIREKAVSARLPILRQRPSAASPSRDLWWLPRSSGPLPPGASALGHLSVVVPTRRNKLVSVEVLRHSWSMSTGFCSGAARLWRRTRVAARRAALACLALVALSRMFSRWRDALLLVKPDTLLRWHRNGFPLCQRE